MQLVWRVSDDWRRFRNLILFKFTTQTLQTFTAPVLHPHCPVSCLTTGICKLCEQLGLDPLEDVRVLVLLWKLGANKKPAEIQRDEWLSGCRQLQLDSIEKFKNLLPSLDTGFMDREEFADFFKVGLISLLHKELLPCSHTHTLSL